MKEVVNVNFLEANLLFQTNLKCHGTQK